MSGERAGGGRPEGVSDAAWACAMAEAQAWLDKLGGRERAEAAEAFEAWIDSGAHHIAAFSIACRERLLSIYAMRVGR